MVALMISCSAALQPPLFTCASCKNKKEERQWKWAERCWDLKCDSSVSFLMKHGTSYHHMPSSITETHDHSILCRCQHTDGYPIYACEEPDIPYLLQNQNTDKPNLALLLRKCGQVQSLYHGKLVHDYIRKHRQHYNPFLVNCLIEMYLNCHSLQEALDAFEALTKPDLHTWNILIGACVKNSYSKQAYELFGKMQRNGFQPDNITSVHVLEACANMGALECGQKIHVAVVDFGYDGVTPVRTALVKMYSMCGRIYKAKDLFSSMHAKDNVSWSVMMAACTENGLGKDALMFFKQMICDGVELDGVALVCALDACAKLAIIEESYAIHALVVRRGYETDLMVGSALLNMYGKCRSLHHVKVVFSQMREHNVVSWTILVSACSHNGDAIEGIEAFTQMQLHGVKPNAITLSGVLEAYSHLAELAKGLAIHAVIIESGLECETNVGTALISMYRKCGMVDNARNMFLRMCARDTAPWNAIMVACNGNGSHEEVLHYYCEMQRSLVVPDEITFTCALSACSRIADIEQGYSIHSTIVKTGCDGSNPVAASIISFYGKSELFEEANYSFCQSRKDDVDLHNVVISACMNTGKDELAVHYFNQMKGDSIEPNDFTYLHMLGTCAALRDSMKGRQIHYAITNKGYDTIELSTALVHMYGTCGKVDESRWVFDHIVGRNVITCNVMISAYAQNGQGRMALYLYGQMEAACVMPDKITFVLALEACCHLQDLSEGERIHAAILKSEWKGDIMLGTSLIDMYGKCGSLVDARDIFSSMPQHNVVSYSVIIESCICWRQYDEALAFFHDMQLHGLMPDQVTFLSVLDAYGALAAQEQGHKVHIIIVACGLDRDIILATALVDMYGKCHCLEDAQHIFYDIGQHTVYSWNSVIAACVCSGRSDEALSLYHQMQVQGCVLNEVTYISALGACASLTAVEEGKAMHRDVLHKGYEGDCNVATALINMYGKCGSPEDAKHVFNWMSQLDVPAWTAMISAHAHNGQADEAIEVYENMKLSGIPPNEVTFSSVLNACCHSGKPDTGRQVFMSMTHDHGIRPTLGHYLCMVDLFGRAGLLDAAEDLVDTVAFIVDGKIWSSLFAACTIHGDTERGVYAATQAVMLNADGVVHCDALQFSNYAVGMVEQERQARTHGRHLARMQAVSA